MVQPFGKETHARVNLSQLALAVDVLSVLGTVALGRRIGQGTHHLGSLAGVQEFQLVDQLR